MWLGTQLILAQTATYPLDQPGSSKAKAVFDNARALVEQRTEASFRAALIKFQEAGRLYREINDESGESQTLLWLGFISDKLGGKGQALEYYEQCLRLTLKIGDFGGQALTLNNIGLIYSEIGKKETAVEHFNRALPLAMKSGDVEVQAATLNNLGLINSDLGEQQKALEYYDLVLPLAIKSGNVVGQAGTLNNMGLAYSNLSDQKKALEYYNQALPLSIKVDDLSGQIATLNNIGLAYSDLGAQRKALEYYGRALPLAIKIGDVRGQALTLTRTGSVYWLLGEKQKALEYYRLALPLTIKAEDISGQAKTLNNIGLVYSDLGEKQKALEHFNQVLPITVKTGDVRGQATMLNNIGLTYSDLGAHQKALEYYNQALSHAIKVADISVQAKVFYNLMVVSNQLNNRKLAVFFGKQSVNAYQQLRGNIKELSKETQQSYLKMVEVSYRYLADLLISDSRLAEGHQVLNLFKDQQFFDSSRSSNESIKYIVLTPRESDFAARYTESSKAIGKTGKQLDELRKRLGHPPSTADEIMQSQKLENDLKIASEELFSIQTLAKVGFTGPRDERDNIDVADTIEMQKSLRDLHLQTGQRTVAVYTLVGADNFRALIISADNIEAVSAPIKAGDLNRMAEQLWGLLQSDVYDVTGLSRQIYNVIFKSIEITLPKDTATIMWSLDSSLRYIPMASLFDGNRFLIERYKHVIFTRPNSERMTIPVSKIRIVLAFGNSRAQTIDLLGDGNKFFFPALSGVTQELQYIFGKNTKGSGVINGEVFSDKEFTKTAFFDALKKRRPLVHISSHFSFRPGNDSRSFLLLGDGFLTLDELKKKTELFQGVELLTLSACDTAATLPDADGKEVDGFAELAQRLGANAVIATLWQVRDDSTAQLMKNFYVKREVNRLNKAEALRIAQLDLLLGRNKRLFNQKNKKQFSGKGGSSIENINVEKKYRIPFVPNPKAPFAHPYYWSPFVLYGNWK